jgi:hypothetical protein
VHRAVEQMQAGRLGFARNKQTVGRARHPEFEQQHAIARLRNFLNPPMDQDRGNFLYDEFNFSGAQCHAVAVCGVEEKNGPALDVNETGL